MAAAKRSQKLTWKDHAIRYFWMIVGSLIYTFGLDVFLVPNSIIDGGVVGISLMATELTGISFSVFVVFLIYRSSIWLSPYRAQFYHCHLILGNVHFCFFRIHA